MSEQPRVRVSTPDDAQQLADLDAVSWPIELQVFPPNPATEPFFTETCAPDDVIVAEVAGRVLGYIRLGPHMRIAVNDHVLHVQGLAVAAEARGRGVASQLVAAAIDEARRRGAAKLGLRVLSNNPAASRVYAKHGFVEEARLQRELRRPDGSYADDVWMALWLAPPP